MKRLSVMKSPEILHRIGELFNIYKAQLPINNKAKNSYKSTKDYTNQDRIKLYKNFTNECIYNIKEQDKKNILNNQFKVQSYNWTFCGDQSWFHCPASKVKWPKAFFSKINYRAGGEYGDIRVIWEPARLQQLIALSYIINSDQKKSTQALNNYISQFSSWYKSNPPYRGPHYISVMECALRIISLCYSSSMIENKLDDDVYWLKQSNIITSHAEIIFERLSLHSSSGNHTLTEASGLIFAGHFYSNHPRAVKWLNSGKKLFIDEFLRQTNDDGSGIEQASWYLKFIYELAIITLPIMEKNTSTLFLERINAVNMFLSSVSINNNFLSFGDSDSGYAISCYLNFIKPNSNKITPLVHYKDTGLAKVSLNKTIVFFNYGNLGMPPSYGHGHADCLSITLFYNEVCILCDTGTGTYNGDHKQRDYFRSTAAHNTVVNNGQSQSVSTSRFMWKKDIKAELIYSESNESGVYLLARHFGYHDRYDCIHYRGIFVSVTGEVFIWDYIESESKKTLLEGNWHLSPTLKFENDRITHERFELKMRELIVDAPFSKKQIFEAPISPKYGQIINSIGIKSKFPINTSKISVFGQENHTDKKLNQLVSFFHRKMTMVKKSYDNN